MDGWMDGWMEKGGWVGYTDGLPILMDEWMDGWIDG